MVDIWVHVTTWSHLNVIHFTFAGPVNGAVGGL